MTPFPTSSKTKKGIPELKDLINTRLTNKILTGSSKTAENLQDNIGLTARHVNSVCQALQNIHQAENHIRHKEDELAAMEIRSAYQSLSSIQQEKVDEKILDNIFGKFCIGK